MPLGNLTNQFFANVYLNELDYFVKHELKIKYYIRYVDDFVILDTQMALLQEHKTKISEFLRTISLELHQNKSRIIHLKQGISFLGFRIFSNHILLKKNNIKKMRRKLLKLKNLFEEDRVEFDEIHAIFEGWLAYAKKGNACRLRKQFIEDFENRFPGQIADVEVRRWMKIMSS